MSPASPSTPGAIHWAGTVLLGIIWGTAFMSMTIALEGLPPLWVATGRLIIGGLTLVLTDLIVGNRDRPLRHAPIPWRAAAWIAVFSSALPFVLLTWGLQTVPSAFAGISMAAVALFVLPMAHFLVPGERLTPQRIAGVVAGFSGVVLLIGPTTILAGGDAAHLLPGRLACIGAALCYAISSILTRRCPPVDSIRLTCFMLLFGSALIFPMALLIEGLPPVPDTNRPLLALLWVGIVPTGIAFLLRVLIIRSAGPGFMSMTGYQVPVWAVIFGATLLGEPLRPDMLLALALILGGIALSEMTGRRRARS